MAIPQLKKQWGDNEPLSGEMRIEVISYLGKRQKLDTDGTPAAPLDCLQKAGVITNDFLFYDTHAKRRWDDKNPRVEMIITVVEQSKAEKS